VALLKRLATRPRGVAALLAASWVRGEGAAGKAATGRREGTGGSASRGGGGATGGAVAEFLAVVEGFVATRWRSAGLTNGRRAGKPLRAAGAAVPPDLASRPSRTQVLSCSMFCLSKVSF